jgi:hypothetical protein
VREVLRALTLPELALWAAYYAKEPWALADRAIESMSKGGPRGATTPEAIEQMFDRGMRR